MDCNDWENNYVMIETPGYPAKYQNKDQCTWKKMDCNDWENNYVMIETPGYPAKYQNKDQCTWTLRIPKESGTWIYCEEFSLNKGDYLFVGKQRYYGEKSWASIEPTQKSTKQNLKLKFKSN